ncbi:MAG: hypothetical protein ABSH51_03535 [Solirubrobacteraceae bacterium]|jgi:hypothetical protein
MARSRLLRRQSAGSGHPQATVGPGQPPQAPPLTSRSKIGTDKVVDLRRRRDQLSARVAELQWDLGGLVYEMAVRDRIRVDLIVKRAAVLQDADAELAEVERILRLEETGMAGACGSCGSPHSTGASYCWQCGQPLLAQISTDAISAP